MLRPRATAPFDASSSSIRFTDLGISPFLEQITPSSSSDRSEKNTSVIAIVGIHGIHGTGGVVKQRERAGPKGGIRQRNQELLGERRTRRFHPKKEKDEEAVFKCQIGAKRTPV